VSSDSRRGVIRFEGRTPSGQVPGSSPLCLLGDQGGEVDQSADLLDGAAVSHEVGAAADAQHLPRRPVQVALGRVCARRAPRPGPTSTSLTAAMLRPGRRGSLPLSRGPPARPPSAEGQAPRRHPAGGPSARGNRRRGAPNSQRGGLNDATAATRHDAADHRLGGPDSRPRGPSRVRGLTPTLTPARVAEASPVRWRGRLRGSSLWLVRCDRPPGVLDEIVGQNDTARPGLGGSGRRFRGKPVEAAASARGLRRLQGGRRQPLVRPRAARRRRGGFSGAGLTTLQGE